MHFKISWCMEWHDLIVRVFVVCSWGRNIEYAMMEVQDLPRRRRPNGSERIPYWRDVWTQSRSTVIIISL